MVHKYDEQIMITDLNQLTSNYIVYKTILETHYKLFIHIQFHKLHDIVQIVFVQMPQYKCDN